jgi:hypothetical protein
VVIGVLWYVFVFTGVGIILVFKRFGDGFTCNNLGHVRNCEMVVGCVG